MKKISINPVNLNYDRSNYQNEYSFLNSNIQHNINNFSYELETLRQRQSQHFLPKLKTERPNKQILTLAKKLQKLDKRLEQKTKTKNKIEKLNQQNPHAQFQAIMPIPIPLSYSPQFYTPFIQKFPPQTKNKQRSALSIKKTFFNPVIVRKFRICIIAVYFPIFLKAYSYRLTCNRKKLFNERFSVIKKEGIVLKQTQKIMNKFLQIDLIKIMSEQKIKNNNKQSQNAPTKTKITNPFAFLFKNQNNESDMSISTIYFVQQIMKKVQIIFNDQKNLGQYHQTLSIGNLDVGFMPDNIYLPQQTPFLYIHPVHGYLRLRFQQQIQLLIIKIMVKIVLYNYLFALCMRKDLDKKIMQLWNVSSSELQEVRQMIKLAAIFIYNVCQQMYQQGFKNISHVSNFNQVCLKFGVTQSNQLSLSNEKNGSKNIKKSQLIDNIESFEEIKKIINQNTQLYEYKNVLKSQIVDIVVNLHKYLKEKFKTSFTEAKQITLNESYLIFQFKKHKLMLNNALKSNLQKQKQWHKIYQKGASYLQSENRNSSQNFNIHSSRMRTNNQQYQRLKQINANQTYSQKNNNQRQSANGLLKIRNNESFRIRYGENVRYRINKKFGQLLNNK